MAWRLHRRNIDVNNANLAGDVKWLLVLAASMLRSWTTRPGLPDIMQSHIKDTTRTLAVEHFAANLKSYQSWEDHSKCSEDICLAYQLDQDNYPRVHFPEERRDCTCSNPAVDPAVSATVLVNSLDSFLLIRFSLENGADEEPVEVLDAAPEPHYVAISDLWSHGLGNPKENPL